FGHSVLLPQHHNVLRMTTARDLLRNAQHMEWIVAEPLLSSPRACMCDGRQLTEVAGDNGALREAGRGIEGNRVHHASLVGDDYIPGALSNQRGEVALMYRSGYETCGMNQTPRESLILRGAQCTEIDLPRQHCVETELFFSRCGERHGVAWPDTDDRTITPPVPHSKQCRAALDQTVDCEVRWREVEDTVPVIEQRRNEVNQAQRLSR